MSNQGGFSLVEGLLIVVIVSIIGFAGYTVWNNNQDDETTSAETSQNETSEATNAEKTKTETTEAEVTKSPSVETILISNAKFSAEIPTGWNYRACMDHDGFGALVAGADGEMRCIWSDATWLDTDMASRARVVVGYSSNPFPIQDWSSGQQKDIYETDASDVKLSDNRTAKKYTYLAEEQDNKGITFNVTEYTLEGVSVFVFDGHSSEGQLISNELSTDEITNIVESTLLPSIKLL